MGNQVSYDREYDLGILRSMDFDVVMKGNTISVKKRHLQQCTKSTQTINDIFSESGGDVSSDLNTLIHSYVMGSRRLCNIVCLKLSGLGFDDSVFISFLEVGHAGIHQHSNQLLIPFPEHHSSDHSRRNIRSFKEWIGS